MVRIIEASAIISGRAGDLSGFDKVASKIAAVSKAGAQVKTSLAGAGADLSKRIDEVSSKLAKIDNFRTMSRGLDSASIAMKKAQQEASRLKAALDAAGSEATRKLQQEYNSAARAVDRATAAFRSQGAAVRDARAALEGAGIPVNTIAKQQASLTATLDRTTAAMLRQSRAAASVRHGGGASGVVHPTTGVPVNGTSAKAGGGTTVLPLGMKGAGLIAGAYLANRAHSAIIDQHHDFQQAYLFQQAVLGLDKAGQQPLIDQAEKIGKDTKFTNADIVRAQTDIGAKLPKEMQKPEVIKSITEHTKNYALAMQVSMEEGAEAVVGHMKSWGYDLSSPEAAAASAKRTANMLVHHAKTTGAKHHDIVGSTKFGAAPSRVGGFSEELTRAVEAQLIRVGYEGSMAGTFSRAVATKLAVPSRQGAAAIAGAGIDYGSYRKPGKDASAEGLSEMLRQRFGRGLNKTQTKALQAILDDPEVMSDKGAFSEKTSELLNSTFARKTKSGKVNAQDAERITKTTDQFYNVVSEGIDTPRLFMDLLKKGLTPALARYLFGQEHGGRAIGLDPKAIERDEKAARSVEPNFAAVVADKMQEGAQGEWNKLTGSVQTFGVALGEATDGVRSWTYKGLGALFDYMTDAIKGKNVNPDVAKNMTVTPQGAPYRLDTWSSDAAGIYERSRRVDAEYRRDPEAARGRAMMRSSAEPLLDPSAAAPMPAAPVRDIAMPAGAAPSGPIRVPTWAEREAEATRRTDIHRVQSWEDALPKAGGGGPLEAVVKPDQVTAKADVNVQGQADIHNRVEVTASSELIRIVDQMKEALISMRMNNANGPGSTGTSMLGASAPVGVGGSAL